MKKNIYPFLTLMLTFNVCFSQTKKIDSGIDAAMEYSDKAEIASAQYQIDLALEYANKAVKADTSYARAYYVRATIFLDKKKDFDAALKDMNKKISLIPSSDTGTYYVISSYLLRGEIKYALKDFKSAIKDFNETIRVCEKAKSEMSNNYARAFSFRGKAKSALGDTQGACEDIKKAKKLNDVFDDVQVYCK